MEKLSISLNNPNKSGMSPSLPRAVFRAFGPGYMILSLAALISECVFRQLTKILFIIKLVFLH